MTDENTNFEVVMQCDHCGHRATFAIRAEYTYTKPVEATGTFGLPEYSDTTWRIIQCLKCEKPTIVQTYKVSNRNSYSSAIESKTDILYPAEKLPLSDLPIGIERAYLAALKVRYEPNAFAVLAGRTLEMLCNHENAPGKVLAHRLDHLANSGRIPVPLAQMAIQLKQLRNLGAHAAEDEVKEEDIPIILDFLEAILEYLYVAPAKIEAVRVRLTRTQ